MSEPVQAYFISQQEVQALRSRIQKLERVLEAGNEYIEYTRGQHGDCDRYGQHKHLYSMYERSREVLDEGEK